MENVGFIVAVVIAILVIIVLYKTAVVVPQQRAYVVERLGKYSRTLRAGFHILVPFIERSAYRHSLKEHAFEIEEQVCITLDNVQVGVDGVLYLQVLWFPLQAFPGSLHLIYQDPETLLFPWDQMVVVQLFFPALLVWSH